MLGKSAIKEMIKLKEREAKINHIKLGAKLHKMGLERHFDEAKKLENEQKLIEFLILFGKVIELEFLCKSSVSRNFLI